METQNKKIGVGSARAMFSPNSFNKEKRTIEVTFSTETPVLRRNWDSTYWEVLEISEDAMRMDRLQNGAPLLNDHFNFGVENVIGVVERAWIEGKEAKALVRFSDREEVQPIIQDVENGILKNISVGYRVHVFEKHNTPNDERPTYRATDWEAHEISLVPIPADPNSQVRNLKRELNEVQIIDNTKAIDSKTPNGLTTDVRKRRIFKHKTQLIKL